MIGYHTTTQAAGAMPNGTRVAKQNTGPGDAHPDGAMGTVIGSVAGSIIVYFVKWDDMPCHALATSAARLREVN